MLQANAASKYVTEGYLSKEDIFEAMAYTYNDSNLLNIIESKTIKTSRGVSVKQFNAEDYSKYTNEQYGGMYIDKADGSLTVCYTDNSTMLKENVDTMQQASEKLLTPEGEILVDSVKVKSVKYGYQELLDTYNDLFYFAEKYSNEIKSVSVDEENNNIVIEIFDTDEGVKVKEEILSFFNEDILLFKKSSVDDVVENIATIGGTSAINNKTVASTPAGQMWSSSKGYYGVITCGHGYAKGNDIYTGTTSSGTWLIKGGIILNAYK